MQLLATRLDAVKPSPGMAAKARVDALRAAVIDGASYGLPAHVRPPFATAIEQLEAGCAALATAVEALSLSH